MQTDLIDTIVQTENWLPKTFADTEKRDWGVLFVTPTIPDSYDGNHACVLNRCSNVASVVDEIVTSYESRGLSPRVNYVSADGDCADLRKALGAKGFTFESTDMRFYLQQVHSRIAPNPAVCVKQVDSIDSDLLTALTPVENLRMAKVAQRRTAPPDAWSFVGEVDGQVASIGLLERLGDVCRVDEVHTSERHRGKGCARAVIHAMVNFYRDHFSIPLYLWTNNPIAERLYLEAGFVRLHCSLTNWCAWRDI